MSAFVGEMKLPALSQSVLEAWDLLTVAFLCKMVLIFKVDNDQSGLLIYYTAFVTSTIRGS